LSFFAHQLSLFTEDIQAETSKNMDLNLTKIRQKNDIATRAGLTHDTTIIRFGFFATGCKTAKADSKMLGTK